MWWYALFAVLVVFCSAVGFGVGSNGGSAWSIVLFSLAAVTVLQIAFVVGAFH